MIDMGLGESIYKKKQLKEFAVFQFSQGTRRAYFAETAELAYNGRNERRMRLSLRGPGPEFNDQHHRNEVYPTVQGPQAVHILRLPSDNGMRRPKIGCDHFP
jgi:hypothetical protein